MHVLVLFPHHLYFNLDELRNQVQEVYLVEEFLFFRQYNFHKQKLLFHRASMCEYSTRLRSEGFKVNYIQSHDVLSDVRSLIPALVAKGISRIFLFEPDDFLLRKRIELKSASIELVWLENQLFINSSADLENYKAKNAKLFQTDFYIHQRKLRNILVDALGGPVGGKWSFDAENRKKYPTQKTPPQVSSATKNEFYEEAKNYVLQYFAANIGSLDGEIVYPTSPEEAKVWLQEFFELRFKDFGEYEDALVQDASFLNHSVLTPMLNVGLLKPMDVIQEALNFAAKNTLPMNSLEGFVRQILGWREFVRYVYKIHGVKQRTTNFWGFNRKIPDSYYEGTTGIRPVDDAIKKLHSTAYNHHIERLMVLSNFMLLCEFDPDEVYRWFMEHYIDAYDWVMVPNVYGMAQFADGGMMVTKPYVSGSNYIFKMSDYKKGEAWADLWDALFWRFLSVNRDFFKRNPRLSMLINTFDKWPDDKKSAYLARAENYLSSL